MDKRLYITTIFALTTHVLFPQHKELARPLSHPATDSILKQLMQAAGVTGLSIGIVNNGEIDYVKSYGFKNKAASTLNDTSTSFYAASLAKPVFAYLVMQLADRNVINLDKPLYEYLPKPLPEYGNYRDLAGDERWKLITARHCLNHTTGFPNWRQLNPDGSQKLRIFFTPGDRYAYSGEGLYLLQLIVETITGQKLEELARTQLFKPFGMTKTSFTWQEYFDMDHAVGHNLDEDTLATIRRTEANAAGSMQTTIADYTRFVSCVLQGKGLSERSMQEMLKPQTGIFTAHQFPSLNNDTTGKYKPIQLSYGLGWGLFKSAHGRAFFKEGHSDDGWQHYTIAFPDSKNALVIMTNSLNGESIFKELVETLTGTVIPWEWEGYPPYQPIAKVPEAVLKKYVGDYTGKVKATIWLEKGQLKIESPTEELAKVNLYPASENHLFMKSMQLSIEFLQQPGETGRLKVNDEGELYELTKVNNPALTQTETHLSKKALAAYVGTYQLSDNPGRTLAIELQNDGLIARAPGQGSLQLVFISDTAFKVKSITDIKGEFVTAGGMVRLVIYQNGRYEWKKKD